MYFLNINKLRKQDRYKGQQSKQYITGYGIQVLSVTSTTICDNNTDLETKMTMFGILVSKMCSQWDNRIINIAA